MIAYLDTSAFVPLLIGEPTSDACRRLWDSADQVASTRLLHIETTAALAQANRLTRITDQDLATSLVERDRLLAQIEVIELDEALMTEAGRLATSEALRGYDSVHCAAACLVDDPELVAGSGDRQLLEAWQHLGLATYDTHQV